MNSFEKYLSENKSSLQKPTEANSDLWNNIEKELYSKKTNRIWIITSIAASLAILFASAFILKMINFDNQTEQLPLYSYSVTYGNAEKDYINAINYQKQELKSRPISVEYERMFNPFIKELDLLDTTYDKYVQIIKQNGCNDLMMELVIKNYQQKLDLLNIFNQELTKIQDYETDANTEQITFTI